MCVLCSGSRRRIPSGLGGLTGDPRDIHSLTFRQVTYLNSVVMPDEPESDSDEEDEDEDEDDEDDEGEDDDGESSSGPEDESGS